MFHVLPQDSPLSISSHGGRDGVSKVKELAVDLVRPCQLAHSAVLQELAAVGFHDLKIRLEELRIAHKCRLNLPLILAARVLGVGDIQMDKQYQYEEEKDAVGGHHLKHHCLSVILPGIC